MNQTIKTLLEHRTIRAYKETPVDPAMLDTIFEVGMRTATSNGMQTSSIIHVTDAHIKEEIATICGQKYVASAPVLLIFLVDAFRNDQIAKSKGEVHDSASDLDRFTQGMTDGSLMAQNMVVAAESLGLGTTYLGSILNNIPKLVELLKLPPLTFPIVGLLIGHPNQEPQLKPRMNKTFRVFENHYKVLDNYAESFAQYDEEMQTYYDLRNANQRVDSFSNQVVAKLKAASPVRQEVLTDIANQGFTLTYKK